MLDGVGKIGGAHHVLAHQAAADAGAQLRRDIVEVRVAEGHGHGLAQIVQYVPHGAAGVHLGLRLILDLRAVPVGVPAVDPTDVVLVAGHGQAAEPGHPGQTQAQGGHLVRVGAAPLVEQVPVDAADPPHQGGGVGAGHLVGHALAGGAGPGVQVAVAGGVDHDLGKDRLAALLALVDHTLDPAAFQNGAHAHAVAHDPDGVLVLQKHFVHLDLQLIGLKVDGTHQAGRLAAAVAVPADAVVEGAPGMKQGRVGAAHLVQSGGGHRAGDLAQAGKPLLLKAADKGFVIPGEVGDHDHIAAGHIAAHIAVALQQDDVFGPCPGGGNGGGVAGRAAADHQDVAFLLDRQLGCGLQISLVRHSRIFSLAGSLVRPRSRLRYRSGWPVR